MSDAGLRLYNTLTRRVEPFVPLLPPRVTFYLCGPTIWNYAHVGNFRTFLLGDILRRYLEYAGYQVFLLMNLTDVDDRIIKAARGAGTTIGELTDRFERAFFEDRDFLRIRPADVYPRATHHVPAMIALVQRLLDRKLAYVGEDGSVYFSIRAFPTYGRLSRLETRELKTGARVASDEYAKEDAQDFALWKAASPDDEAVGAAWDAPFGRGRPGWHLECSAMALAEIQQRFGIQTLDLHGGGKDLVFPHHENEIAQSEGSTGVPFARAWLHAEFLTVAGTKMSKRFGNILTARDLREEGADPAAFRLLALQTHYRKELNYTDDALRGALEGARRIAELRRRLVEAAAGGVPGEAPPEGPVLEVKFRAAMNDDLNTPEGVAALFTFAKSANRALDERAWTAAQAGSALAGLDRVLGVFDILPSPIQTDASLADWVEGKLADRQAARRSRDFGRADAIREEILARGIELEDTPAGTRWRVARSD
jgi:cysteinyl-tRNA synthetase